jgi:hypothetical protein
MLIDVAFPGDRNVIKKEGEKFLEYKDLIIQIQCRWNVKATIIPVITGDWNHFKSLGQYLSNIPGKHEINELQTMGILVTAHILWEVLM